MMISGKRLIHRIWVGDKPLPDTFRQYGEKIKKLNPECEVILWSEELLKEHGIWQEDLQLTRFKYTVISDYYRVVILNKFGGLYLDTDVEPINPFPVEYWTDYEVVLGIESMSDGITGSAVIFSEKEARWTKEFIDIVTDRVRRYEGGKVFPPEFSGPRLIYSLLKPRLSDSRLLMLPPNYFYPIGYWEKERLTDLSRLPEETLCVHHWAASWH